MDITNSMASERNKIFLNILFRVIFTSLGAVAEIFSIAVILKISLPVQFVFFVIFLISIIYLWDFYREYSKKIYKIERKIIFGLLLFLTVSILYITLLLRNSVPIYLPLVLLGLSLLYDSHFKKITAQIVGFKDFFVIICFNLIVLIFLLINNISPGSIFVLLLFVLSRDFVNITYCDIKDIESDSLKGYKTLAIYFGIDKLIKLHSVVSILSIMIIVIAVILGFLPVISYFLIFPVVITMILIFVSHSNRKYTPTNVDFEYFGWLIFVILGKIVL